MISKIYKEFLEELRKLGGLLSPEQEIALEETRKNEEKGEKEWKKKEPISTLG
jgi:hypothetical protein